MLDRLSDGELAAAQLADQLIGAESIAAAPAAAG